MKKIIITVDRDGDQWCAKHEDFIDLQESSAGFGDTPIEAITELLIKDPRPSDDSYAQNLQSDFYKDDK